jgi:hypothetical protein
MCGGERPDGKSAVHDWLPGGLAWRRGPPWIFIPTGLPVGSKERAICINGGRDLYLGIPYPRPSQVFRLFQ